MRVLAVVLDLGCSCKPVTKGQDGLSRPSKIPAMHISVDGACGQQVRVVGGKVDVCDGPAMALQGVLDGTRAGVIAQVQIPDQSSVIGGRDDPIVARCKG